MTTRDTRATVKLKFTLPGGSYFTISAGLALCIAWFCVGPVFAGPGQHSEQPYALIFGTVWSADGRPVYGVKVKIHGAGRKAHWELYSDHHGEFAQRVPAGPGDYIVSADLKGHKPQPDLHIGGGTEVTVHIENDERTDIGLHLK